MEIDLNFFELLLLCLVSVIIVLLIIWFFYWKSKQIDTHQIHHPLKPSTTTQDHHHHQQHLATYNDYVVHNGPNPMAIGQVPYQPYTTTQIADQLPAAFTRSE